ncbi:alginate O-acetyltransferase AlgX-related protein [Pseudomonas sp. ZS1P83]
MNTLHGFTALCLLSVPTWGQAQPQYTAEACCQLCPQAAQATLYEQPELKNYATLVEAKDKWLFRTRSDFRTEFGLDESGYKALKRLRDGLAQRGVELVLVMPPSRGLLHADRLTTLELASFDQAKARQNYVQTLDRVRDLGIQVPDFTNLLSAPQPAGQPFYFKGDHNWTPYGAERSAQLVAQTLKGNDVLKALPHQVFASQPAGLLGRSGTLQKVAAQICGNGYAAQFVTRYQTRAQGDSKGAAKVALIGTSASGDAFNFAGFIEQYLETPVRNFSLPGGGYDDSLIAYLLGDDFQKSPPVVLVWETDNLDSLGKSSFYRQAMAALSDGCDNQAPLLKSNSTLHSGRNQVLFNGGGGNVYPIKGNRYLVDLKFADPAVHLMNATLTYMNGRQENISLNRSPTVNTQGRFAFELRADADWDELTFLSMDVQPPPGTASMDLSARLCAKPVISAAPSLRTAQTEGH